jgi:hypothetical protein
MHITVVILQTGKRKDSTALFLERQTAMDDDDYTHQMEDLFGPLAPHAEFSVGQLVHYSDEHGVVRTGEITWIEGPGKTIRGDHHPLQYWVNGLICLYQSDILGISYE